MVQPQLEVADIFRDRGPAWRQDHALSLAQLKAMSAIERCRSAALGGHVLDCVQCADVQIAYNSCRNRHGPKCQGSAARRWLEDRQTELLPVAYYHVVFTLPAAVARIAHQNPTLVYNLLFKVTAQTLRIIAADPKHLGVSIGMIAVLHTWGSALTHHPHLHCIVPGGGLDPDGKWKPCKNGFFLPVFEPTSTPSETRTGWFMPNNPSVDLRQFLSICLDIPIASPSQIAASSIMTTIPSPLSGKIIGPEAISGIPMAIRPNYRLQDTQPMQTIGVYNKI